MDFAREGPLPTLLWGRYGLSGLETCPGPKDKVLLLLQPVCLSYSECCDDLHLKQDFNV